MSVIVTLLLVASIAVNLWLFRRQASPKKQSVRSTLLQGIKNVRELTTLRQNFQSVVMFKDAKAFWGVSVPGTGRKFILKYGGVAVCGSDLENIQITERFAVNRVVMTVPRAKLLDVYADMKSVQVYDQRAGIFTSVALSDQNREISNNLEEVRRDAENSDLLRRADDNTRMVLTSLAASLGMEAEVIFEDSRGTSGRRDAQTTAQPVAVPEPYALSAGAGEEQAAHIFAAAPEEPATKEVAEALTSRCGDTES